MICTLGGNPLCNPLCRPLCGMPRRLCFDSAIGVVRTLFWLLSSLVQPLCKNLRRFADGASDVDWGEAICATMIPQGHLGGSSLHSVQTIVFLQLFIFVFGGATMCNKDPPRCSWGRHCCVSRTSESQNLQIGYPPNLHQCLQLGWAAFAESPQSLRGSLAEWSPQTRTSIKTDQT